MEKSSDVVGKIPGARLSCEKRTCKMLRAAVLGACFQVLADKKGSSFAVVNRELRHLEVIANVQKHQDSFQFRSARY